MSKRYTTVQCTGHEAGRSKGDHPQLRLDLIVVEGERTGESITSWNVLATEKSFEFAAQSCRALGMTNDNILEPVGLGTLKARCVEVQETFNGKTAWKAKYINPIKPKVKLTGEAAESFAAAFSAALAGTDTVDKTELNAAGDTPEKVETTTDTTALPW